MFVQGNKSNFLEIASIRLRKYSKSRVPRERCLFQPRHTKFIDNNIYVTECLKNINVIPVQVPSQKVIYLIVPFLLEHPPRAAVLLNYLFRSVLIPFYIAVIFVLCICFV